MCLRQAGHQRGSQYVQQLHGLFLHALCDQNGEAAQPGISGSVYAKRRHAGLRTYRKVVSAEKIDSWSLSRPKNGGNMQPVETTYADRVFVWAQLSRHGAIAIYTQTHRTSGIVRYEVVKIREAAAHTWPDGSTTPAREVYPGKTSWGQLGWTFFTQAAAERWATGLRQGESQARSAPRLGGTP